MFQGTKPRLESSCFPLSSLGLVFPQHQTKGTQSAGCLKHEVCKYCKIKHYVWPLFTVTRSHHSAREQLYQGSLAFVLLSLVLLCLLCPLPPAHQPRSLLPEPLLPPDPSLQCLPRLFPLNLLSLLLPSCLSRCSRIFGNVSAPCSLLALFISRGWLPHSLDTPCLSGLFFSSLLRSTTEFFHFPLFSKGDRGIRE